MEKSKYEAAMTVLEIGSFSGAANALGYTPSGLNRMMSSLEQDLGVPIFKRTKKGVTLTDDGEKLLPYIQKIVYWERQLKECTDERKGLETGTIRIGTIYSIGSIWLPDMIHKFKELYPGVIIQVSQGSHQELNDWIEDGTVDLIFTTKRADSNHWVSIKKDPIMVWVDRKSELAKKDKISKEDFEASPYIITMPGEDTDAEYLMKGRNLKPDIQYSSLDCYTTYRMVEAGLGISLCNQMMSEYWSGNVAELYLDPPAYVELGVRYAPQCSIAAQKFISLVRESL